MIIHFFSSMFSFERRRARIPKEDLAKNVIFVAFRDVHQQLWNKIGEEGLTICIPHSLSIITSRKSARREDELLILDENFLITHTLRNATYVPGIGDTDTSENYFSNLKGQILKHSSMSNTIGTMSGFESDRLCLIVDEQVIYDDFLRRIVVWIIDRPIIGAFKDIVESEEEQIQGNIRKNDTSISVKYQNLLGKSVDYYESILGDTLCDNLNRHFQQFIESYICVKGYSNFTLKHINRICKDVLDQNHTDQGNYYSLFLATSNFFTDNRFNYCCSLEYIQLILHDKLFIDSCSQYIDKDGLLLSKAKVFLQSFNDA